MSDFYVGEIRMFSGNYAPENWLPCDGRLLSVSEYEMLFSLIGTTYGGTGGTTFALPDLRGRIPVGQGQGANLGNYAIGQSIGGETATVAEGQLPAHAHLVNVVSTAANTSTPGPGVSLAATTPPAATYLATLPSPAAPRVMDATAIGGSGVPGAPSHANVMPSLVVSFIIATTGIYPVQA